MKTQMTSTQRRRRILAWLAGGGALAFLVIYAFSYVQKQFEQIQYDDAIPESKKAAYSDVTGAVKGSAYALTVLIDLMNRHQDIGFYDLYGSREMFDKILKRLK